jgi:hypothetical protein
LAVFFFATGFLATGFLAADLAAGFAFAFGGAGFFFGAAETFFGGLGPLFAIGSSQQTSSATTQSQSSSTTKASPHTSQLRTSPGFTFDISIPSSLLMGRNNLSVNPDVSDFSVKNNFFQALILFFAIFFHQLPAALSIGEPRRPLLSPPTYGRLDFTLRSDMIPRSPKPKAPRRAVFRREGKTNRDLRMHNHQGRSHESSNKGPFSGHTA